MIVNSLVDGWEIIYQRAHANLAAMIVAGWRKSDEVLRSTELIIATAQHDDQEMFWDQSIHLTDQGAPLDFMQGRFSTTLEQVPLIIANANRQGLYIALMISMHNCFLYEPKRGTDAKLDVFLDEQIAQQKAWRKQMRMTQQDAQRGYSLLLFGDSLSLILCRRQLPIQQRALEVAPMPDGTMVRVIQREDDTISLDPWVFEEEEMHFSLEVRRLHQLQFKNEREFMAALDTAIVEQVDWHFRRA